MLNKILITASVIGLFILPRFCDGAVSYSRSPSSSSFPQVIYHYWTPTYQPSFTITNPDYCGSLGYWGLRLAKIGPPTTEWMTNTFVPTTTLTATFSGEMYSLNGTGSDSYLPVASYNNVYLVCGSSEHPGTGYNNPGKTFEYNSGSPVFTITAGDPAPPDILSITQEDITGSLAYVGRLFTDLTDLIVLILGILVGFFVIKRAIGIFNKYFKNPY